MTIDKLEELRAAHHDAAGGDVERIIQDLITRRAARRATQAAVAARASVTSVTICALEARRSPPTLATLARVARALGYKLTLSPVGAVVGDAEPLEALDEALREKSARDAKQARRAVAIAQSALEVEHEIWPWAEAGAPVPAREV